MSDSRREIEELRGQTSALDLEILKLLEERAKLARRVGRLTAVAPAPHVHERERLRAVEAAATGDLPVESVRAVFKAIHAACASLEGPTRAAYVGTDGSFGHVATRDLFGAGVRATGFETAAQALDELARGRVDHAVVPYESSTKGPVLNTILALLATDLMVVGQCELPAGVALMSRTGNVADIEKVYAGARDHVACQAFLASHMPRVSIIDVRSPAIACQFAAEDHGGAAIAHEAIGDMYGLAVVLPNIGEHPDLRLRYALVGTRPSPRTGNDITSIVFTLHDEPGALVRVLGDFAKRGVNVRNIMSRPMPGEAWDYIFYMDVVGHATDRSIVAAMDEAKKSTKLFRVIGSFPARC